MIKTTIFGKEIKWDSRIEAISYCMEQIQNVPRREQEHYIKVLKQLVNGCDVCSDEVSK